MKTTKLDDGIWWVEHEGETYLVARNWERKTFSVHKGEKKVNIRPVPKTFNEAKAAIRKGAKHGR